ncbi:MAG: Holliday junction branch migration protein RuvA, partial [Actinomycetota bacterium]
MIGSLRGSVLERTAPSSVLIEVHGVGYLCIVTSATFAEMEPTSPVFVHVHHHIRDDAQTLYAFTSRTERDTFDVLIATHGIGPAMAMAILSTYSPQSLVTIVASGDTAALTAVPGVGKKTAERLMVELKSRLNVDSVTTVGPDGSVQ